MGADLIAAGVVALAVAIAFCVPAGIKFVPPKPVAVAESMKQYCVGATVERRLSAREKRNAFERRENEIIAWLDSLPSGMLVSAGLYATWEFSTATDMKVLVSQGLLMPEWMVFPVHERISRDTHFLCGSLEHLQRMLKSLGVDVETESNA